MGLNVRASSAHTYLCLYDVKSEVGVEIAQRELDSEVAWRLHMTMAVVVIVVVVVLVVVVVVVVVAAAAAVEEAVLQQVEAQWMGCCRLEKGNEVEEPP